jgi:hypothetical protein
MNVQVRTCDGLLAPYTFLSQPVEQAAQRRTLRQLLGDSRWPQALLRIGYGCPTAASPRRLVEERLIMDPPVD